MPDVLCGSLSTVLAITNHREPLGLTLVRAARLAVGQDLPVYSITYAESLALLTPRRVDETDLFIPELFRPYPRGRRAEGVFLAERWRYRKSFLIVAPLHVAHHIQCPGYWDTAVEDSLVERIRNILSFPDRYKEGFEKVQKRFTQMLTLPPQH